jgi:hypothetical protein
MGHVQPNLKKKESGLLGRYQPNPTSLGPAQPNIFNNNILINNFKIILKYFKKETKKFRKNSKRSLKNCDFITCFPINFA